ncbi:MAG: hypothetical protein MI810_12425 [Flavobacteriales bacterium]|nr:hypothetical protein [Flavobacteriales bacterium]
MSNSFGQQYRSQLLKGIFSAFRFYNSFNKGNVSTVFLFILITCTVSLCVGFIWIITIGKFFAETNYGLFNSSDPVYVIFETIEITGSIELIWLGLFARIARQFDFSKKIPFSEIWNSIEFHIIGYYLLAHLFVLILVLLPSEPYFLFYYDDFIVGWSPIFFACYLYYQHGSIQKFIYGKGLDWPKILAGFTLVGCFIIIVERFISGIETFSGHFFGISIGNQAVIMILIGVINLFVWALVYPFLSQLLGINPTITAVVKSSSDSNKGGDLLDDEII